MCRISSAKELKQFRLSRNMTQKEFGKFFGYSAHTIRRLETGRTSFENSPFSKFEIDESLFSVRNSGSKKRFYAGFMDYQKQIVTSEELDSIIQCYYTDGDSLLGKYDDISRGPMTLALEFGFLGFAGGLDHVEEFSCNFYRVFTIFDRGVNNGSFYRDNSIQFIALLKPFSIVNFTRKSMVVRLVE